MALGDYEVLVIGADVLVLLGRQVDPRHARLVDALAQEGNRLIRFDDVLDPFVQTLIGSAKELFVLDEALLSGRRHCSLTPGAAQPKTGSARPLWVFDDRIPVPGHEHADTGVVAVIGGDQVAARMPHSHLVVRSRDENRVDTALVAALAEELARLVLEPGIREAVDALVDSPNEERVPDGPIRRGHLRSR